jgi:hypothetical protein
LCVQSVHAENSPARNIAISAGCVLFVRNFILSLPLKNTHSTSACSHFICTQHTRGNFHADEFSHLINCLADESERQVRGVGLFALRIIDHRNYFDERRKLYASSRGEAARRAEKSRQQVTAGEAESDETEELKERLCVLYRADGACSDWPTAKQINLPLKWPNQLKHANSAAFLFSEQRWCTLI